jgi:hypothetical protein
MATRVGIGGRSAVRYAPSRTGLALMHALASHAPVHVADPLMEGSALPVEDGDLPAQFLDVSPGAAQQRRRYGGAVPGGDP